MFKLLIISGAMMMLTSVINGQDCPVTGQKLSDCASPCNLTCNNRNNVSCLTVCTTGCSCPAGTVIDEETNSCVAISSCPVANLTCPNITGVGSCDDDCSSDDDCDGNLLCCSNGCGRHCTEPLECAGVTCLSVACSVGAVPAGECCTVCGCSDTDGGFVRIGDTYMDDCNTCTCLGDNYTVCTEITCAPDCPVTGQERSDCASPCNLTCNNYRDLSCTTRCVVNGCQCPTGTVINEETNSCVAIASCPVSNLICPNVTGPGSCLTECNSDFDCDENLLCCSNGCGSICTEPVVDCAGVQCPDISCSATGVPDGECCATCGCTDTDEGFVKIGDTFMDDCNTCTCDGDDTVSCSEIACGDDGGSSTMVAIGYTWLAATCAFIIYMQYE